MIELSSRLSQPSVSEADVPLDQLLDAQLRQLLHDLQLLVPYDVAAAWLGHDDRPSLRVSVPASAELPSLTSTRHWIFQTTTDAARIADLFVDEGVNPQGLRCWLGVPLVLHGRRRGWIEVMSTQPNLFSDADLQRTEVVVRHAAAGMAQLENAVHMRNELRAQRELLKSLEGALVAPSLLQTLERLVADVAASCHSIEAALLLPVELAYTLGLNTATAQLATTPAGERDSLVSIVARWAAPEHPLSASSLDELDLQMVSPGSGNGSTLLPFVHEDETLGWLWLKYAAEQPLVMVDPIALRQVRGVLTALLVWLREQLQREQQAQQSVRMLVQHAHQQRSEEITDLMAGLAHELNNPLSAVLGVTTLLGRDPSLSDDARADVEAIRVETKRINDFVTRLSNFGHRAGEAKVPVKLNDVVTDTLALIGGLAGQRGIMLRSEMPDESPVVLANRGQLQNVCLDLLSNALDAVETSDVPQVTIEVRVEAEWAVLRVSDNGYGIPEDVQARIWTPSFTTKISGGTRRGLGIGLPMALDIVRNHWGTIQVISEVWQGSTFSVRLPLI